MKKTYFPPYIKTFTLAAPALMITVSKNSSAKDDEDSDRSKAFWGPTLFDEECAEEADLDAPF